MSKQIIYVQANVLNVSEVDTISQTYYVDAVYKLRWRASDQDKQNWAIFSGQSLNTESKQEEELQSQSPDNDDKAKKKKIKVFEPTFIPKISFPNAQDCELMVKKGRSEFYELIKSKGDSDEGDMVVYDFQIDVLFAQDLNFKISFDCQGIYIFLYKTSNSSVYTQKILYMFIMHK